MVQGSANKQGRKKRAPAPDTAAKEAAFLREYLISGNREAAAKATGSKGVPSTLRAIAANYLAKPHIKAEIAKEHERLQKKFQNHADRLVDQWAKLAFFDARSIMGVRRGCCRYCYGDGFQYQWRTQREYDEAFKGWQKANRFREGSGKPWIYPAFDDNDPTCPDLGGGFGYNAATPANPMCPECDGEGVPRVHINSTDDLSPDEALGFDGAVERATTGLEIKLRDRDKAADALARHLGLFSKDEKKDDASLSLADFLTKGGQITLTASKIPVVQSPEQAEASLGGSNE